MRIRAETAYSLVIVLLLAGLGFSIFAWYETVNPAAQSVCSFNSWVSCGKIDNSGHTTTLGIEDYAIGIAAYALMTALAGTAFRTFDRRVLLALAAISGLGVLFSAYLAYLELIVIQGLCPVCLGAYVANVGAFLVLLYLVRLSGAQDPAPAPSGSGEVV